MELVDMPDLGSGAARRGGSTPFSRTKGLPKREAFFYQEISFLYWYPYFVVKY